VAAAAADTGPEPSRLRGVVDALIGEALKDVLRNLRDHTELQRRIVRGDLDRSEVNRAYVSYARREGGEYRKRVAELTAAYYADLAEVGNRYSADFYEEVLGNGSGPPATEAITASAESPTRVPMELHGAPGKEVIARFSLENTDPDPVDAVFEVGVCQGPDGEEFTAPLSVHPARVTVPAGGREEITIRLAMLPSVFAPGQLYRTVVRVAGYRQLELDLVIWAEEPIVVFPEDLRCSCRRPRRAICRSRRRRVPGALPGLHPGLRPERAFDSAVPAQAAGRRSLPGADRPGRRLRNPVAPPPRRRSPAEATARPQ
jgi:hypothetical protein